MKKIIIILFLVFISIFTCFSQEIYTVQTSHGDQQVIIPDGYTAKDILLTIAQAYYELSWDYDELSEKTGKLTADIEAYIIENQELRTKYQDLVADYQVLTDKLSQLAKVTPLRALGGIGLIYSPGIYSPSLYLGAEIYERFGLMTSVGWLKDSLSIGLAFTVLF